jgi:co-chaperonin GroES (HSP10)
MSRIAIGDYKVAPNHALLEFMPDVTETDSGWMIPEGEKQQWARIVAIGPISIFKKLTTRPHLKVGMIANIPTRKGQILKGNLIVVNVDYIKVTVHEEDYTESQV